MGQPNLNYGENGSLEYLIHRSGHKPKCFYCNREFSNNMDGYQNMSVDHIESQHDGGSDLIENLVLSCKSCNSSKGKQSFSIKEPDEDLKSFQKYRSRMKIADDYWVKNYLFEYSKLTKMPDSTVIIKKLYTLMNENQNKFKNVEFYNKKQWLQWENHTIQYYFRPKDFTFQPILEKKDMDDSKLDALYAAGFFPEHQWGIFKHIKPFCYPETGLGIICSEMDIIVSIIGL